MTFDISNFKGVIWPVVGVAICVALLITGAPIFAVLIAIPAIGYLIYKLIKSIIQR